MIYIYIYIFMWLPFSVKINIVGVYLLYPFLCDYAGFESPSELDDHHMFFGIDGQDLQSVRLTISFDIVL